MARPIKDHDSVVLDRMAEALAIRTSVRPWTLAEIAPAAGLSPAGLLKRFGSRQGVLGALSRRWIDAIPARPVGNLPPRDELYRWAGDRFAAADAHATARGLTQLVDDLVDDELRTLLAEGWRREIAYVAALLSAMDLPGVHDPLLCAGVVHDSLNGVMLRNAAQQQPALVARTLDTLLEAWT